MQYPIAHRLNVRGMEKREKREVLMYGAFNYELADEWFPISFANRAISLEG